jgi:cytoskeletal protein CcmA (bactofilin family)
MIRMGRSNKTDEPLETPKFQENFNANSSNSYNLRQEIAPTNRAMSESESMARDIKEGRLSGYVGNGTVLTGETGFQAMLRVDGHLTGRVTSENGTLIIGSTGRVDANIIVAAAIINGMVNGDIVAMDKIELGRTARVVGNIQTPKLVIEEGAIFEGSSVMLKAKEAFDKRIAESKSNLVTNESNSYENFETSESNVDDEVAEAAAS